MTAGIRGAVLGCLIACGGKPVATQEPDPEGVARPALPDVPFADLDLEQRVLFMKEQVVPAMAPLFRAHDPVKYAEVGCPTCHRDGAADGDFGMPNEQLPVLDLADTSNYDPADLAWMTTQIKPAMAKLLREPEHTAETPSGFGCLDCHPAAGQ